MKTFQALCLLEIKRNIKLLPWLLLRTVIAAFLVLAFCILYSQVPGIQSKPEKVRIGVVLEKPGREEEWVTALASSMESVQSICVLEKSDRKNAEELLEKGIYSAVIYIPEKFVEHIMTGVNQPSLICFSKNSDLGGQVFKELADSGASLLSTAQAAVYALDETLSVYQINMSQVEMEEMVSQIFMNPAMNRNLFFEEKNCSYFQKIDAATYFGGVFLIGTMLFSLVICGQLYQSGQKEFFSYLYGKGLKPIQKVLAESIGISAMAGGSLLLLLLIFQTGMSVLGQSVLPVPILLLPGTLLLATSVGCFVQMIFSLGKSGRTGCQLLFLVTLFMVVIAGGIVPISVLPDAAEHIRSFLPFTIWMNFLFSLSFETALMNSLVAILLLSAVCIFVSVLLEERRKYHG